MPAIDDAPTRPFAPAVTHPQPPSSAGVALGAPPSVGAAVSSTAASAATPVSDGTEVSGAPTSAPASGASHGNGALGAKRISRPESDAT